MMGELVFGAEEGTEVGGSRGADGTGLQARWLAKKDKNRGARKRRGDICREGLFSREGRKQKASGRIFA